MPDGASENLKTRLARAQRADVRTTGMTAARAWRMCVPRVSESAFGLIAAITGFEESRASLKTVIDQLPEQSLMFRMECYDDGLGLALLDSQLIASLVEVQTTGKVTDTPLPERPCSLIDAAICSHVVDRWQRGVDVVMGDAKTAIPLLGCKLGGRLDDRRAAALALEDTGFFVQKITFDIWEGARTGEMVLYHPIDRIKLGARGKLGNRTPQSLLAAETELAGVLYQTSLSLDDAKALELGDIIAFPASLIGDVSVRTSAGNEVATARLGQAEGYRALRLNDPNAVEAGAADPIGAGAFAAAQPPSDGLGGGLPSGDLPGLDTAAPLGGADPLPDLPGADLPDLPGMPDMPAMPDLPDLPATSDLPDLPGLPDLPDLPDAGDGAAPLAMDGLSDLPPIE